MSRTTDHILVGGRVSPASDPLDVYRDFMAVPQLYEEKYSKLRDRMSAAGIAEPRLAVTELQLFASIAGDGDGEGPARLTRGNLVNPATQAEALYDTLVYHMSARLAPFVEMVTHSATVNHGGGLRKERERVYANPCHHAQTMFAAFAGARPVPVELCCFEESAPGILSATPAGTRVPELDALAALAPDGALLISLVHRGTSGPVSLSVELGGFEPAGGCEVLELSAERPWTANTLEKPDLVAPVGRSAKIKGGRLALEVSPNSVLRLRIPASG